MGIYPHCTETTTVVLGFKTRPYMIREHVDVFGSSISYNLILKIHRHPDRIINVRDTLIVMSYNKRCISNF